MSEYFRIVVRDMDKAQEQLARGLQVAPNNAELLAASGQVERTRGNHEAALGHLQRAVRMDPRSLAGVAALARVYHDLHRYEEATAEYDRALSLAPTNLSVIQGQARVRLSQGDIEGARRVIRAAAERVDAKSVVVRFAMFEEMMWVLPDDLRSQVVELRPEDFGNDRGMWALKVGATYRLSGNAARAREYGALATGAYGPTSKQYPKQQELFGRALALARRCAEAAAAAKRALAVRASPDPYIKYQVARIDIQCDQHDGALDLIEQILATPGPYTPGWLRIDPIFSSLKGDPRFERLLQGPQ